MQRDPQTKSVSLQVYQFERNKHFECQLRYPFAFDSHMIVLHYKALKTIDEDDPNWIETVWGFQQYSLLILP